jgi:gamma-glutamyltranspeptidase/glutathione hydrolase
MLRGFRFLVLTLALLSAACSDTTPSGKGMVATADRYASDIAASILAKGGSATDAAIAAQLVLTLTEPQSSGIGGGLFMLHYDKSSQSITTFDGREKAPLAANEKLFLKSDGKPMAWLDAALGGRPVGTPGVISAMWKAHQKFGKLKWADLFAPAIMLAEHGFVVGPRLANAIAEADHLEDDEAARETYFLPDTDSSNSGAPAPAGYTLKNPAYAKTLRLIAAKGPDGFYKGEVAEAIAAAVRSNGVNPGLMTLDDLAAYEAVERAPVCMAYRQYNVCGMAPPTSGGLTTLMTLGLLEPYHLSALDPDGVMVAHLFAQASRLAFADRNKYMADPDFVDVPAAGLLDKAYLRSRSRLINPLTDMGQVSAGEPQTAKPEQRAADNALIEHGTSHLAIVDGDGNAVSMTMSVERSFGARITAGGFVLNNQLTDFSFVPSYGGNRVVNRVEAGKRPRSSMSPTIILNHDGSLFAAVGSPGGSRIIGYTTRAVLGLIDWQMPVQQAVSQRHVINRNNRTEVEEVGSGSDLAQTLYSFGKLAAPLADLGHEVQVRELTSGLQGIRVLPDGKMDGGADPRREGVVIELQLQQ